MRDAISSFRELIGTLEKLILSKTPLVVVAPDIAADVLATLEVNTIRHTMRLLASSAMSRASVPSQPPARR